MATDAQSLINSVACYQCYTSSPYMAQLIELALLRQLVLAQNPGADVSPNALLDQVKCFECYSSSGYMLQLLELSLLLQLTGGGTGGGQLLQYTGTDPTSAGIKPAIQSLPAVAYSATGVGSTYTWNTTTFVWQ